MTKIEAFIDPFKLEAVISALAKSGINGVNVTEVQGRGGPPIQRLVYRGVHYVVDFTPTIKLEMVCLDSDADEIVSVIGNTAQTGKTGDGMIFVSHVLHALRIRNGQIDEAAL